MPFEQGLWRIDGDLIRLSTGTLDNEASLESFICADPGILSPDWLVIGRQIRTDYGGVVDLLAVDASGTLVLIELKKELTPREVVAQALDYAAWVESLQSDQIAAIFDRYTDMYRVDLKQKTLNEVFRERFRSDLSSEELNQNHRIVIVAARLDACTERIVTYLANRNIDINVLFFQIFQDAGTRFLSRVWFLDPATSVDAPTRGSGAGGEWNGEFYVSFGEGEERRWEDAVRYGFVSAGGGAWYTQTLHLLGHGDRVFVNIPGHGYVGVGVVEEPAVRVDDFCVRLDDGRVAPILQAPLRATEMGKNAGDPEKTEYVVRVRWVKTVPVDKALKEVGFFGNQNSVCKPKSARWVHTVERLRQLFGVG